MTKTSTLAVLFAAVLGLGVAAPGDARVIRIEITERTPYTSPGFTGAYGPYETVRGQVYHEVDPSNPLHAGIVDLDKAPPIRRAARP
jgi:hypothetical protein